MPTAFAPLSFRPAAVALATWLIVLQTVLGGVATGPIAAVAGSVAGEAICHGAGSADPDDGSAPESGKGHQLCCLACTSSAPALAPPDIPKPVRLHRSSRSAALARFVVVIAPGAVRAGFSQAPPSLA